MPFANRADFLAAVARDLGDPEGNIWTEDDLSRMLDHALSDLARVVGVEQTLDLPTTGSIDYDLTAYPYVQSLVAVEWPLEQQPLATVQSVLWEGKLRLKWDEAPPAGQTMRLYYRTAYTVDESGSNVPAQLEEVVVTGARAYALLQQSVRTAETLNVDSWVSRRYELQLERAYDQFREGLAKAIAARIDPPTTDAQPSWYPTI